MSKVSSNNISKKILHKAFSLMSIARQLSCIYESNKEITSKYVHATSKGHEAIQLAVGLQLKKYDWVSPYYRDDSMLLSLGISPYELMLQLFAKKDDPFSGGRTYYSHPSLKRDSIAKFLINLLQLVCKRYQLQVLQWDCNIKKKKV